MSIPAEPSLFQYEVQVFNSEPKCQAKIAADDILIFYLYLLKKIRLDFSCESSASSLETSSLIFSEKQ